LKDVVVVVVVVVDGVVLSAGQMLVSFNQFASMVQVLLVLLVDGGGVEVEVEVVVTDGASVKLKICETFQILGSSNQESSFGSIVEGLGVVVVDVVVVVVVLWKTSW